MFTELNTQLVDVKEKIRVREKIQKNLAAINEALAKEQSRLGQLEARVHKEAGDVAALERLTLAGLFYTILGSREQQLEKERQDQLAAVLKRDQCYYAVASLKQERSQHVRQLRTLTGLDEQYASLLKIKEQRLLENNTPSTHQFAGLTEKINDLQSTLKELKEAVTAGEAVRVSLEQVIGYLEGAESWGMWDMLGGGLIATALKHGRIDDARAQAHRTQELLRRFRRELVDIRIQAETVIEVSPFEAFADHLLDGLIVDWIVQAKIENSLTHTRQARDQVKALIAHLEQKTDKTQRQLQAYAGERLSPRRVGPPWERAYRSGNGAAAGRAEPFDGKAPLGMRTHHDSLETVLSQTDTAVVVEIQSVGRPEKEGFHLALEMTATPLKLLFGRVGGGVLACTYFEGLPHLRGHTKISPRVTGSGLESQIKAGDRVIFLLSSDGTLLRAEALEHMARVVRPGPQPDAFSGGPEMP